MGASNPHPHGQIWAGTALPVEAGRESASQARHLARTGHRLLLDYVAQESGGPRVVVESDEWLVVVPFWAAWPFETLLIPRRPAARLPGLDAAARDDLADVLLGLLGRYDGLFRRPFPYSMGWHQAPFGDTDDTEAWQVHAHFYPPLLRATVRKFMVGYELLAETQRDLTAEDAAERLRAVVAAGARTPTGRVARPSLTRGRPALGGRASRRADRGELAAIGGRRHPRRPLEEPTEERRVLVAHREAHVIDRAAPRSRGAPVRPRSAGHAHGRSADGRSRPGSAGRTSAWSTRIARPSR